MEVQSPLPAEQHHRSGPVHGRLRLAFAFQPQPARTTMQVCEQHFPLQVIRAFPIAHGAALVHTHNLSGGVLGGDHLRFDVDVGAGARAQITSTGATRLYRSRADVPPAEQVSTIRVGPDALLEYLPDPLIPYAGARYRQTTRIELAENAGLVWWEIVAPGREAHGELFAYDLLQIELEIIATGRLVALERVRLEPALRPLNSPLRLGQYRYYASMYLCRAGEDSTTWTQLEADLAVEADRLTQSGEVVWGVSTLPAHGLAIRALGCTTRSLYAGLLRFWQMGKQALYSQAAIPPRKLY